MLGEYAVVKAVETVVSFPNESFSVRGLAERAKISPATAGKALEFMKEKGIVSLKIVGRTFQYRADLESALCRQWKILFNLDEVQESKIVEEILKQCTGAQAILLYGSFAKGTNSEKSDIDILVIAQGQNKNVPVGKKAKKETNITAMTQAEWKRKAIKDKAFYENVIFDSIVLHGERPVVL